MRKGFFCFLCCGGRLLMADHLILIESRRVFVCCLGSAYIFSCVSVFNEAGPILEGLNM